MLFLFSCAVMSCSFATQWTVAHQAPLSTWFPRQQYWNGLPFPSPGDLPNTGTEPTVSRLAGRFFTTEPPGKPWHMLLCSLIQYMMCAWVKGKVSCSQYYVAVVCLWMWVSPYSMTSFESNAPSWLQGESRSKPTFLKRHLDKESEQWL